MSYTQRYHTSVRGSFSYNFPPSQNGGSGTLNVEIPLDIDINVDTDLYDQQVAVAAGRLAELSGTVDETKNAELVSIRKNSETISSTIVGGFFSYIRSDLSQQISELRPKVDSKFVEMLKQKEAALAKMNQMTEDFQRIAARYTKIFMELDKETRTRILALDAGSFKTKELLSDTIFTPFGTKLISTSTITNQEETSIRSKLYSSRLRKGTRLMIEKARDVIASYKRLGSRLDEIMTNDPCEVSVNKYLPVVFSETVGGEGENLLESHCCTGFAPFQNKEFHRRIESIYQTSRPGFKAVDAKTRQQLSAYIKTEIDNLATGSGNDHSSRVKNLIWSLWEKNNDLQINRD